MLDLLRDRATPTRDVAAGLPRHSRAARRPARVATARDRLGAGARRRVRRGGARLGYGGGYYDRLLPLLRAGRAARRRRLRPPGRRPRARRAARPRRRRDRHRGRDRSPARRRPSGRRSNLAPPKVAGAGDRARGHARDPDLHLARGDRDGRARAGDRARPRHRAASWSACSSASSTPARWRRASPAADSSSATARSASRRPACCCARPASRWWRPPPAHDAGGGAAARGRGRHRAWATDRSRRRRRRCLRAPRRRRGWR